MVYTFCFYNYDIFQDPNTSRKLPPLLKYDEIRAPPPPNRAVASQACPCTVCELARLKNLDYKVFWEQHSNPVGAPKTQVEYPPSKVLALCTKCFITLGKGVTHDCSKSNKGDNLANIVNTTSPPLGQNLLLPPSTTLLAAMRGFQLEGVFSISPVEAKACP